MSAVLLPLLFACMKAAYIDKELEPGGYYSSADSEERSTDHAIGTLRTRDGQRYIQLDAVSAGLVVNPDVVADIPDETRVFLQYRCVLYSAILPEFCSDAILVEWATPLDTGEIRYDMSAYEGDPLAVNLDWMTSLEDGFLTLHYSIPSKGKASHGFSLYPGATPYEFRLVHDANGDTEGDLTDGLVCFRIGALLPDTGGKTVTLSLTYLYLDHTWKTLTVDYRTPK